VSTFQQHLRRHPFVIAGHRGAAGLAPENTLASYSLALELGVTMLELDVHRAHYADGRADLVVIHDNKVNRTTNAKGTLEEFSIEALRQLDAGDGQSLPLLSEVLDLLTLHTQTTGRITALNIELKGEETADLAAQMLSQTFAFPIVISSFEHFKLTRFRTLMPQAPIAPLYHRYRSDWATTADDLNACAINISAKMATQTRIKKFKAAGYAVFVYTVNSLQEGQQLRDWGASGLFTDRPDILMPLSLTNP
jgi:glycerophosphoryl diester phosphodiesterase